MQTFLPFPEFERSAAALDYKRLGKQRVECLQILNALTNKTSGWKNHPATRMWRGYEKMLCIYAVHICSTWRSKGYQDSLLPTFQAQAMLFEVKGAPPWLGTEAFHRSHQSNLIRKLPEHYGPPFPGVPSDLPYVWPVVEDVVG